MTGDVIEIWDERPDKPFDRDTELRLTGQELAERGVSNLAEALSLLPELHVREAGRGGQQVDIRGARKGSVKILVDGVSVTDPFYGTFDIGSIPVTDIVQIRVSSTPSSPIDGVGGPGGVIEVHTRDAIGPRLIAASARGSSLPEGQAAATGRSMLGDSIAVRVSAQGTLGSRDFTMSGDGDDVRLDEARQAATGALRLEYRRGAQRVVADVWAQARSFVVPPGEDYMDDVLVIDGETAGRAAVAADDQFGAWRVQARGYAQVLGRDSTYFADASLSEETRSEDLSANRIGVGLLANRPLGKTLHAIGSLAMDTEDADVVGFDGSRAGGRSSIGQLSAGLQYEDFPLQVDAAIGLAVPAGIDAAPWSEFKIAATYRPVRGIAFVVTGARKGRIPTLRERFRVDIGNAALGPEQALFGEIAVKLEPVSWAALDVAGYVRDTNGLIRFDAMQASLINLGDLTIRGVDARLEIGRGQALSGGLDWSFTDAYAAFGGTDPLDFLPRHRAGAFATVRRGERMGATARVQMVGARIDRNATLPRYAIGEVSAFAALGAGLVGNLRVANALDERFEIRSGGVRDPGRVMTLSIQGQWQ